MKRSGSISSTQVLKGADLNAICDGVEAYYTAKITRHGAVPLGVDWSCKASQQTRFIQLLKVCSTGKPISMIDLGCGYGALADFLIEHERGADVAYLGIDLSPAMVRWARERHRGNSRVRFASGRSSTRSADYAVASGIMNVKLDVPRATWERFVRTMLVDMHRMSELGFAVNFVRKPAEQSDPGRLYCTTPEKWVRFCEEKLGRSVEIIDDYGLEEFTLLARKNSAGVRQASHSAAVSSRDTQRIKSPARAQRSPKDLDRVKQAALLAISPDGHLDDAALYKALALLRAEAPVYWVECPGMRPFWLVTRHADISAVESKGAPFIAAPRSVLSSEAGEAMMRQVSGKPDVLRSLFQMDEPEHRAYRDVARGWFSAAGIARLEAAVTQCAHEVVERSRELRGSFDFASRVAVPFPMRIMMEILGLPEADDPLVLKLARGLTGAEDPDRALSDRPAESIRLAGIGFREYFNRVTADRRRRPRPDLASAIANARVAGKPIPEYERLSYFMQLAIAGQENTAYSIAGGVHALLEHPDQMAKLQANPQLLNTAVEEILRWTSPGRHLMRTATTDTMVGGQLVRSGESVALFFNSANRDEAVFVSPNAFTIDRSVNPHLAFGSGPHFCLGVHLARLELRAIFTALLPMLPRLVPAGPLRRARSAVISGISSLPVRWC